MQNKLLRFIPHGCIILSLFLGTLWVLDQLNPMMNFLENSTAKATVILLCLLALGQGVLALWREVKNE